MAAAQDNTVIRTFKCRLLPTKKQRAALTEILESQRILYNAAKQERDDRYCKTGICTSYEHQCKSLTILREEPEYNAVPLNLQRWTIKRCDDAYRSLSRRLKSGTNKGFPRFRSRSRWRSFGFKEFDGITLRNRRVRFKGLPSSLRVHLHRPLPTSSKILGCTFTRDAKGWFLSLQVRTHAKHLPRTGKITGIDLGLKVLCALSTGESIPNPCIGKRHARELRRRNRALSRCKRTGKRRTKVKRLLIQCHNRIGDARRTYLHQVSARLVRENDALVIEDLNVKGLAGGMLAKSVHDAGWSTLRTFLMYKAESAGRELIAVDPNFTSQTCPECGQVAKKTLKERIHRCDCGCVLDRDHAAAKVILARWRSGSRVRQRKAA